MVPILSANLCHQIETPSNLNRKSHQVCYLKLLNPRKCQRPMARSDRRHAGLEEGDNITVNPKKKSVIEYALGLVCAKSSKELIYGRPVAPKALLPSAADIERPLIPPAPMQTDPPGPPNLIEPYTPSSINTPTSNEEPTNLSLFEKPIFVPPKSICHSKISPSSIPNPSPSISTTKQMEPGYPNYGSYLYSIPGYSAFQPVSYPGIVPPQQPLTTSENSDFVPYPLIAKEPASPAVNDKEKIVKEDPKEVQPSTDPPKAQTDFEDQFTPEIVPAVSTTTIQNNTILTRSINDCKMSITSLSQGSGATVTISTQVSGEPNEINATKDLSKKKPQERFSLKTSIPISKIDMKCVSNAPEPMITNAMPKKTVTFAPLTFTSKSETIGSKVEIQSNIIIKGPTKETENIIEAKQTSPQLSVNNISALINTADSLTKNDCPFKKPEPKNEVVKEIKDPPPNFSPPNILVNKAITQMHVDPNKMSFTPKPPDGNFNEQKNQILVIQNTNQNPKMLLTIQQQNPQVLLQRTNFESKNVQVPSRLSSQSKNCKEEVENGTSSKVVALKRLHQENCDENDFENLITENQIYGNKIVVKEKNRTLQEQKIEKPIQEPKNVVLQPNFVYLSNVQFPANLMMIKNNTNVNQATETNKVNKITGIENKTMIEVSTVINSDFNAVKNKAQSVVVSKDIHVIKPTNSVIQTTLSNINSKPDIVLQPHQKVLMNPQIVYQVPMQIINSDSDSVNKFNQPFQKFITQKKDHPIQEQKANDKVFIACPYKVDSKTPPKLVLTNIRPKVTKVDEVSSLDLYEKRKRLRRLKYLSNRDTKEVPRADNVRKVPEKIDVQRNLITPDRINEEICKEFTSSRGNLDEGSSDSESDYDVNNLNEYEDIINKYGPKSTTVESSNGKAEFLAHFSLGTPEAIKEKNLERQEKIMRRDKLALAYIAAGRIDRLTNEDSSLEVQAYRTEKESTTIHKRREEGNTVTLQKKEIFLSELKLKQVTSQFKEGYEKIWKEIVKDRKRRNGEIQNETNDSKLKTNNLNIDTNGQLQMLTEIKRSVNENNNLIKKKLDADDTSIKEGDSIHTLAEKNISELNRLSKMADISVKLIKSQDARKRDLNPGFDSENIQKSLLKFDPQPVKPYPNINIPNIAKIISLKTQNTTVTQATTTQATSMDEPMNSAAGVEVKSSDVGKTRDFGCQVESVLPWPGIEAVKRSYREYDAVRRKQLVDLQHRNTALRVEGAVITRNASRDSDHAKALLSERQHLIAEEAAVKRAINNIMEAIEAVKECY